MLWKSDLTDTDFEIIIKQYESISYGVQNYIKDDAKMVQEGIYLPARERGRWLEASSERDYSQFHTGAFCLKHNRWNSMTGCYVVGQNG